MQTAPEVAEHVANGRAATIKVSSKKTGAKLVLCLRPASSDQMSPGKPVGVPSWVPSEKHPEARLGVDMQPIKVMEKDPELCRNVEKCFYFAVVMPDDGSCSFGSLLESQGMSGQWSDSLGPASNSSNNSENSSASGSRGTKSSGSGSQSSKSQLWKPLGSAFANGDFNMPAELASDLDLGALIGSGGFGKGKWRCSINTLLGTDICPSCHCPFALM